MEIKTLVDIKTSNGWRKAGSILEFSDSEAQRLIDLGACVKFTDTEIEVVDTDETTFETLDGMEDNFIDELKEIGFDSIEKLANADVEDLTPVNGIGKKTAKKLIQSALEVIDE